MSLKAPVMFVCAGCVHSGLHYDHGANWRSAENPCDICICSVGGSPAESFLSLNLSLN